LFFRTKYVLQRKDIGGGVGRTSQKKAFEKYTYEFRESNMKLISIILRNKIKFS